MIHLRSISLPGDRSLPDAFPFTLPIIQSLATLDFTADVTFFVGENGSGKSTLLEAIACAAQLPTVGAESVASDPTLAAVRDLADQLKWAWTKRTRRGFFLRAEDFFGYAKMIARTQQQLAEDMRAVEEGDYGSEYARNLARSPHAREQAALRQSYGDGLDAQSHGESFFKLFNARFVPDGLYLLDEPEAPLSPNRQLTLIAMMKLMIDKGAQFIVATHSPMLLAYPGATLLCFDGGRIQPCDYESLEHVTVMRSFLANPQAYLKHLLDVD